MFDHWAVVWLAPVAAAISTSTSPCSTGVDSDYLFIDIVSSFAIRPFPGPGDAEPAHAVQRRIAI